MAEVEAAKAHGRQLITDAQALRERVLADLARRRDAGRAQIAHLKEGRDRLLGAYEIVRRTLEQAVDELRTAAPEARAIDVAAQAVALSPPPPVEDDETEGIRILTPPAPDPELGPNPRSWSRSSKSWRSKSSRSRSSRSRGHRGGPRRPDARRVRRRSVRAHPRRARRRGRQGRRSPRRTRSQPSPADSLGVEGPLTRR